MNKWIDQALAPIEVWEEVEQEDQTMVLSPWNCSSDPLKDKIALWWSKSISSKPRTENSVKSRIRVISSSNITISCSDKMKEWLSWSTKRRTKLKSGKTNMKVYQSANQPLVTLKIENFLMNSKNAKKKSLKFNI